MSLSNLNSLKAVFTASLLPLAVNAWSAEYATEMTVAQDGSGDYASIQAAIDATKCYPYERITINIKPGVYQEKVEVYAWNTQVSLIGEDRNTTIITHDDYFDRINKGRNSTFHTYTLKVAGDDFHAENLTVVNSAGPVGQAVALHVEADRASFDNISIKGWQDTLYVAGEGQRSYFNNCYIEGSIDFIFGGGTALFEQCEIKSLSDAYITAASTPANQDYGFVFKNSSFTAASDVDAVYLGRPWRKYAKTVFIDSELGAHILPAGWHNWDREENEATVFYAEYNNSGAGAVINNRVSWSHQLRKKQLRAYANEKILNGWDPSALTQK